MRVAILGCGYVGIECGRRLERAGHDPVGVRRSDGGLAAIRDAGFDAVRADLTDPGSLAAVPDVDGLVFLAAPDDRDAAAARRLHVDGLRTVIDRFAARADPPDRLLYASTTGVYGDHGGDWVDETTPIRPPTAKTRAISVAEGLARQYAPTNGIERCVVRFAGLYGPDRYRLDYLEGPVTEGYLNLLHRDDAARILQFLLERGRLPTDPPLVLAVDDEPVWRPDLARWLADARGVEPPPARSVADRLADLGGSPAVRRRVRADKRCSNDRLRNLGYVFEHPTFRSGYREAVGALQGSAADEQDS